MLRRDWRRRRFPFEEHLSARIKRRRTHRTEEGIAASDDPAVRARRSAIAALAAFVDVPVVHFSVEWWRTLHQKGTVFNRELNPTIEGNLAWALLSGVVAFTLLYLYLLERRYRLAVMEEAIEGRALDAAIAERRAEADVVPV